jgi:RNA polymerase sigma-70 factor, ECF subfamily
MTLETERSLVQAARSGDMRAFEQLYRQTKPIILSSARRLAGRQDAEDLLQDTYARALTSIVKFRGECRLMTWLYRILFNLVAQKNREKVIHPMLPVSADQFETASPDFHVNIDLQRGLKALSASDLRIVRWELEGYTNVEIAREAGVSTSNSTVRARLWRARRTMQLALSEKTVTSRS